MQRALIVIGPGGVEVMSDGELEVHIQRDEGPTESRFASRETPEALSESIEDRSADPVVPEKMVDAVEAAVGRYVPPKHVLRLVTSYSEIATPRLRSRFDAFLAANSRANHHVRTFLANEIEALRIVLAIRGVGDKKGGEA